MPTVILNAQRINSREMFHNTIAEQLDFPSWYGKNLDALYDCLTDLREDTLLYILHPEAMEARLGDYGENILATLQEAQEENRHLSVHLCREEVSGTEVLLK